MNLDLFKRISANSTSSLSVTGMAKNCGKTTVLNYLIREGAAAQLVLGITSAGRDGEKIDIVTGLPKPAIYVPQGSLVVTAAETLEQNGHEYGCERGYGGGDGDYADIALLLQTDFMTPLGPLVLGRVRRAGKIEIIGGNRFQTAQAAIELLQQNGASLTLVDGAANRVFLAAPALVEAVVLATGAAVHPSLDKVLDETAFALEVWKLPQTESAAVLKAVAADAAAVAAAEASAGTIAAGIASSGGPKTPVIFTEDWDLEEADVPTVLGHEGTLAARVGTHAKALVLPGALTDELLERLSAVRRRKLGGFEIVVQDPTRVLASAVGLHRFQRRGGKVSVLKPVHMAAVTLNPYSPYWPGFDAQEFLERAAERFAPLPVYDVVLGRKG
ncbi:MAG TPA: hypothetical protein DDZ65_12190 [Firmicutes bacterium]|nr:hypothetical protein [Bacillota bacterium]